MGGRKKKAKKNRGKENSFHAKRLRGVAVRYSIFSFILLRSFANGGETGFFPAVGESEVFGKGVSKRTTPLTFLRVKTFSSTLRTRE